MSLPHSHNKNPGIKREFYPLPEEDPDGWRCVEVHIPDGDEYLELLRTVLKSLTLWFNYARDIEHRGKVIADRFAYALQLPELGCDMNCEELQECLAPLLADVAQIKQDLQDFAAQAAAALAANGAKSTELPAQPMLSKTYGSALALIREMDTMNRQLYSKAEESFVDNAAEWIAAILDFVPAFEAQGVNAGAELANAYFANQVTQYETDYPDFEAPAACDLMTRVDDAGGSLTYDIWGDWLNEIESVVPDNAAAKVFTKYSPLRQTFLNQIAAFFNQNASLQHYFNELWNAYFSGAVATAVPADCGNLWEFDADVAALAALSGYSGVDAGTYSSSGWGAGATQPGRSIFGIEFSAPARIIEMDIYRSDIMDGDRKGIGWEAWDLSEAATGYQENLMESFIIDRTLTGILILQQNGEDPSTPPLLGYCNRVVFRGKGYQPPELGG